MTVALPKIIQGGMGAGVSSWPLAQAVSRLGQLGVVSGTAIDLIFSRRLQDGDPGGDLRRAVAHFPFPKMAARVWEKHFRPNGRAPGAPYDVFPMHTRKSPRALIELTLVANFAEVFLAREGHSHPVGINVLEKIQLPHLPSLYGAMLAGVGYVLMGAGIPHRIPGVLDAFAGHQPASYPLYVAGAEPGDDTLMHFDPKEWMEGPLPPLTRPLFLPIVASNSLATMMSRKSNGKVDGFVIEGPTAGGHNAPPRGTTTFNEIGEPVYGERDEVDLEKIKELGLPFWVAGGYATAEKLQEALARGAAGIQVGTAFAFCEESGLSSSLKQSILQLVREGRASVKTDARVSPTGFPFKVARLAETISDPELYKARKRVCDLGYLRTPYRRPDGETGYRCASEPIDTYLAKGGTIEETEGRGCLCNALLSNIGLAQKRAGGIEELPLVTCGDDLVHLGRFLGSGRPTYTARDVVEILLASKV